MSGSNLSLSATPVQARYLRFGKGRWDRNNRRLTIGGASAKLPWRVAECLNRLLEAGGEVVKKEDLRDQIWGGALVEDSNLAQCIATLRKLLDPAPDGGSHIETVARVGYRLSVAITEEAGEEAVRPRRARRYLLTAGAVALVTALAGGLAAYYQHAGRLRVVDEMIYRALALVRRNDPGDAARANELLREAMRIKPDYPLGQAATAELAARRGLLSFEAAIKLARLAVQRDPRCGECEAIAGYVLMTRAWKWEEARVRLERSIAIDGESAARRLYYAEWLAVHGRYATALENADAAIRASPADPRGYTMKAAIHYLAGRYREAIREAENAISLDSRFNPAHYWIYRSSLLLGDDVGAIMARARSLTAWNSAHEEEFHRVNRRFLHIYHEGGGRPALARAWLAEVSAGPALEVQRYARAVWYVWIAEKENALAELEAAVKSKPYHLMYVAADPAFAPLRDQKRFQEVVRQVGLETTN